MMQLSKSAPNVSKKKVESEELDIIATYCRIHNVIVRNFGKFNWHQAFYDTRF